MPALNVVFILALAVFIGAASFGFILVLMSSQKDRAVKRRLALRFYPDQQGNYPYEVMHDGTIIEFQPGNSRYQVTPHYIIQPTKSEVVPALPAQPEVRWKVFGSDVEVEQERKLPSSQAEVVQVLLALKEGGATKTQALKQLGITGGNSFKKYAKIFDTLP